MTNDTHDIDADTTRASRDGHEFHELWAARRSLQLVFPQDRLHAIAVEGLSIRDPRKRVQETEDVADLTLYFGGGATLDTCERQEIIQFKYSVTSENKPAPASYLKKTIVKFAETFAKDVKNHSHSVVSQKVRFGFITNRPLSTNLVEAIKSIRDGTKAKNAQVRNQAANLNKWCGEGGANAKDVLDLLIIKADVEHLQKQHQGLKNTVSSWSPGCDHHARARLFEITTLLRRKAGTAGSRNNLITREDILDALGIDEPEDLFPAEARFPPVGLITGREQLAEFCSVLTASSLPQILHADGGIGKTVFVQDLQISLSGIFEVILFDCFGGGVYRSIGDERHLPSVGLLHIINELAAKGLCDPLLPTSGDARLFVKAAHKRLRQSVATLQQQSTKTGILLVLDAADNAAEQARRRNEQAFPTLLLQALDFDPIEGVKLVLTGRSHRVDQFIGSCTVEKTLLRPFSRDETKEFLAARVDELSHADLAWAYQRSGGNGRVLEYLVSQWEKRGARTEESSVIDVTDLIAEQVKVVKRNLENTQWSPIETNAFFASLALLPPPIPLEEFGAALDWDVSAIRSAVSDLAPMLELVPQGVIFRDEPTETYIDETFSSDRAACREIADRLAASQDRSAYAAEVLPRLFETLGDTDEAYNLA